MEYKPLVQFNPTQNNLTADSSAWLASRLMPGRGTSTDISLICIPGFNVTNGAAMRTCANGDVKFAALLGVNPYTNPATIVNYETNFKSITWRGCWMYGNNPLIGRGHATRGKGSSGEEVNHFLVVLKRTKFSGLLGGNGEKGANGKERHDNKMNSPLIRFVGNGGGGGSSGRDTTLFFGDTVLKVAHGGAGGGGGGISPYNGIYNQGSYRYDTDVSKFNGAGGGGAGYNNPEDPASDGARNSAVPDADHSKTYGRHGGNGGSGGDGIWKGISGENGGSGGDRRNGGASPGEKINGAYSGTLSISEAKGGSKVLDDTSGFFVVYHL